MKLWIILIVSGISTFFLASALLYWGLTYVSDIGIRLMLIGLVWLLPTSVGLAYYFGKTEARGFLAGADKIMDSTLGKTIDSIERRRKPEIGEPVIQITQPMYPQELRQISAGSSIFDYPEDEVRQLR